MPTFQDARDGLDALLKDGKPNLSPDDIDKAIIDAGRAYSRRRPQLLSKETTGDGGFDYSFPTGYVDGFSTIREIFFPYLATDQNPVRLEPKDFHIFQRPDETVIRFRFERPTTTQAFLTQFTAPHTVSTLAADVIGILDPAATEVDGDGITSGSIIDVEKAADVQVFIEVSAAVGNLMDVIVQASEDGVKFFDVAAFGQRPNAVGNFVLPLPKEVVSKKLRLKYTTTGGSFTFKASLIQQSDTNNFTIPDHTLDAFNFLSAAIASQMLADFYAHLIDNQLEGETIDYEGKSVFWQENANRWDAKWEKEIAKAGPRQGNSAFKQGEWDLVGSTKFPMLTHAERHR